MPTIEPKAPADGKRAQLGQRALRRTNESFETLVWRITQGQRHLRPCEDRQSGRRFAEIADGGKSRPPHQAMLVAAVS